MLCYIFVVFLNHENDVPDWDDYPISFCGVAVCLQISCGMSYDDFDAACIVLQVLTIRWQV
jgi:hypothetical protein